MSEATPKSAWPIELLRILVWPLVTVFLVALFWTPLQGVLVLVPTMFEKLEAISVGGVTFNVRSALVESTPNNVKLILPRLTPAGIQYILENGEAGVTRATSPLLQVEMQELIQAGLCRELTKDELKQRRLEDLKKERSPAVYNSGMECGDSYDATRKFFLDLIPDLVRQATAKPLAVKKRASK